MDRIKNNILGLLKGKVKVINIEPGKNNDHYFHLKEKEFKKSVPLLSDKEYILVNLFCVKHFETTQGFTLFYTFAKQDYPGFAILYYTLKNDKANSIAWYFPVANWYEREIADGFGINFIDSFDKRRLFLHEIYPDGFHPLLKSFKNSHIELNKNINPKMEYAFNKVEGEGVYQIPVGPVHAGIIEPGHFRFNVIGEKIINLEIRMFYKHRGIEKLAEGKSPMQCLPVVEAISGDENAANSVCFCNAVEKICGIKVPTRALALRTIYLELERIYSLLGDLAGMVVDVAYPVGASNLFILREEILRYNESFTGSRFMKGAICVGGVTASVAEQALNSLFIYLDSFLKKFIESVDHILANASIVDRFETTGVISADLVNILNLTGPLAKASTIFTDARVNNPYCLYHLVNIPKRALEHGDVAARFKMKLLEISDSVEIIQSIIKIMSSYPKKETGITGRIVNTNKEGYALSVVEAPRGQNLHWVYIRNGKIYRYKVKTASFCNWHAIEHAVTDDIVPDFPLINKSLNLSYAGTDL
jgi:formate hydrogenlyase subunit 5